MKAMGAIRKNKNHLVGSGKVETMKDSGMQRKDKTTAGNGKNNTRESGGPKC